MTDVIVCGGGVAGSTLAVLLGRAGVSVEIFEQHRFPREKTCAEGIFPGGVGVLQRMGLLDAVGGARICGVRHHAFGQTLSASFPPSSGVPAFGLGQRRLHLDSVLFETARATPNVVAREGVRVEAPIIVGGRVIGVVADGTPHHARLIVAADGPRSTLRRQCGLDGPADRRPRLGVRGHFRLAPGLRVPERVEVFFTDTYELYLTPLPDGEVVLAGLAERSSIDGDPKLWLRTRIAEHAELRQLLDRAEAIGPITGQGPLSSRARRGFVPGLVLLGDAAGFVDPVTGTGMAQALLAAELLAHTLAQPSGFDPSDATLARFERERRRLLADSVLLTRLVLELTRHPRAARAMLQCMRAVPGLYTHMIGVAGGTRTLLPLRALYGWRQIRNRNAASSSSDVATSNATAQKDSASKRAGDSQSRRPTTHPIRQSANGEATAAAPAQEAPAAATDPSADASL